MSQLRLRRMQIRAAELVRDFYESLLMLTLGVMMQWNQWHVMRILNAEKLPEGVSEPQPLNWSSAFFTSGLLLTLLQYRPQYIKRLAAPLRKLFLLLEVFIVLFLVDYVLLSMWQPFLNIFDQVLHVLGHSKCTWARILFRYWPGLSTWLINDAFYFMRFVASLSWFLLAIEMSAPKWRLAIDFLLLGQLPDVLPRHRRRRLQSQC
ncbi:hypothetical protein ACLKA7_012034 [Drosophila subpalustris]